MSQPTFDLESAHRFFAADCFNKTWDEMEKPFRTAEEDERMLLLTFASHWHWTQRPDCTPTSLSISCWQISRVYALLGQAEPARQWAERCLQHSQAEGVEPFYRAFAYEALARAAKIAGDAETQQAQQKLGLEWAALVMDEEERKMVLADLEGLA